MFINITIILLQQPDGASRGAPEGSCLELCTVLFICGCVFYVGRVTFLHNFFFVFCYTYEVTQSIVSNMTNVTQSTCLARYCLVFERLRLQFLAGFLSLNLKVNILCLKDLRDHFKKCPVPPHASSLLSHH